MWWTKYLVLATIPALLLVAVLLVPKLQAFSSVDTITVVEGAGLATSATAHTGVPTGQRLIGNKTQAQWLDEQLHNLGEKLESDIDARISKKLSELVQEAKSGRVDATIHVDLDQLEALAASKVEKAMSTMQEKIKLNLNLEKRVVKRLESKLNDKFDKDLDSKFATTAEQLGLRVVTPGMKPPGASSESGPSSGAA